ncbi:preprotein translocase subunit SecE [Schaalia georgiae]|nr:preprotein translocase subunit SecE [Schaalia georgiae]
MAKHSAPGAESSRKDRGKAHDGEESARKDRTKTEATRKDRGKAHEGEESARKDRTKARATRKRDEAGAEKQKKRGLFARMWLFLTQVVAEMRKVTYPTRSETWTYFVVVVVFVTAIMAFTGLLDFGFGKLSALLFG